MESPVQPSRRRWAVTLGVLAAVLAVAGCGKSKTDYKNEPRPPETIVLTAYIGKDRVSVSPAHFGAGPVNLIITNQSGSQQTVTIQGPNGRPTQHTGPLSPSDTATLKLDIPKGRASVKVDGGRIRKANLTVGPQRASSQDKLLLP